MDFEHKILNIQASVRIYYCRAKTNLRVCQKGRKIFTTYRQLRNYLKKNKQKTKLMYRLISRGSVSD